jgi:uncharacterized membrane protein required for colicin V production
MARIIGFVFLALLAVVVFAFWLYAFRQMVGQL